MNNQRIVSDLNIIKPPKWNNVILSAVTGNPVPYFYKKVVAPIHRSTVNELPVMDSTDSEDSDNKFK